jgi:hypothetical protein
MGRIYAGTLGFTAFALVVTRGLLLGGGSGVMLTAAAALLAFATAGWVIGTIAESTIRESVEATFNAEVAALDAQEKKSAAAK